MTTGVDKGSMFTPSALTSTDTEDGQAVGKEYSKITKENVNWTSGLSGNPSKTEAFSYIHYEFAKRKFICHIILCQ